MASKPVTPAAYAKSRGLDKSTISRQIKAGQIPTLPAAPGKKRVLIDPDVADAARARNIDVAKSQKKIAHPAPAVPAETPSLDIIEQEETPADFPQQALPAKPGDMDYTRARTASVTLDAQKKRISLLKETGELVTKRSAEDGAQKAGRMTRDRILAAGDDVVEAIRAANSTNEARTIMRQAMRRALEDTVNDLTTAAVAASNPALQ